MTTTEAENTELVHAFHQRILTEHDLDAAADILAETYVEHNPALPEGEIRGREALVEFWESMFEGIPDATITELEVICKGNTVAARTLARGTHDGPFMGLDPTGNEFEVPGMEFIHIENGKIAETWVCFDSFGMMQQLGAVEPPGE